MSDIANSFQDLKFTLTALPITPKLEFEDLAEDGYTREERQLGEYVNGADGGGEIVLYNNPHTFTFNFLSISRCIPILDRIIALSSYTKGARGMDYLLGLIIEDKRLETKEIYGGGRIISDGQRQANRQRGKSPVSYKFVFGQKIL
jgi:hypothetical protein